VDITAAMDERPRERAVALNVLSAPRDAVAAGAGGAAGAAGAAGARAEAQAVFDPFAEVEV
jgi:hypothetical protein